MLKLRHKHVYAGLDNLSQIICMVVQNIIEQFYILIYVANLTNISIIADYILYVLLIELNYFGQFFMVRFQFLIFTHHALQKCFFFFLWNYIHKFLKKNRELFCTGWGHFTSPLQKEVRRDSSQRNQRSVHCKKLAQLVLGTVKNSSVTTGYRNFISERITYLCSWDQPRRSRQ